MNRETEKAMHDHQERRENDRGFFAWHRVTEAVCCDPTQVTEAVLGVIGFALKGALMLLGFTSFPPNDVRFLLRSLPLPLTEGRLGWALLMLGLIQALAIGTKSHVLRGSLAIFGGLLALTITVAYVFADVAPYFQAWVGFLGIMLIEFWLALRNFKDRDKEQKAQAFVRAQITERRS